MPVRNSQNIPETPVANGNGVRKAVLISAEEAPNFAMRRFTIETGGGMPLHTNLVEHEQYVLRGRARVRIALSGTCAWPDRRRSSTTIQLRPCLANPPRWFRKARSRCPAITRLRWSSMARK